MLVSDWIAFTWSQANSALNRKMIRFQHLRRRRDGMNNLGRRFCASLRLDCCYRRKKAKFRNWIGAQTPLFVREREEKIVRKRGARWVEWCFYLDGSKERERV